MEIEMRARAMGMVYEDEIRAVPKARKERKAIDQRALYQRNGHDCAGEKAGKCIPESCQY